MPVELCNLRYEVDRGACIDPHFDDSWLWGNRLVTINLLSNTILTLHPGVDVNLPSNCEVYLPLSRRSIVILSDDSRYKWMHSVKKSHIKDTRVAITLRELSQEFKKKSELRDSIERLALTFMGVSVGCVESLANLTKLESSKFEPITEKENKIIFDQIPLLKSFEIEKVKEVGDGTFCVNSEFMVRVKSQANVMNGRLGLNLEMLKEKLNVCEFEEVIIDDGKVNVSIQKYLRNFRPVTEDFLYKIGIKIAEWTVQVCVKVFCVFF